VNPRDLTPLEARVLPFRRPSAAVRVRRRSVWATLGRPFAQALALVATPAALVTWGLSSPSFALSHVDVSGNRYVSVGWIRTALGPLQGENLFRLSLDDVERRLRSHPWLASVNVEKQLPDRLRVAVVERRPAGLLRTPEGLVYVDREGHTIAPLEPGKGPSDLLLLSIGTASDVDLTGAFDIADELVADDPSWGATLSEVEVLGGEDYRLFLGALPFPLLARRGTLADRLPALRTLLPELERRYPHLAFVDLRSERRIVFQPVVERS
jgi:hypothetical protein